VDDGKRPRLNRWLVSHITDNARAAATTFQIVRVVPVSHCSSRNPNGTYNPTLSRMSRGLRGRLMNGIQRMR
jgi:hypothetical protein